MLINNYWGRNNWVDCFTPCLNFKYIFYKLFTHQRKTGRYLCIFFSCSLRILIKVFFEVYFYLFVLSNNNDFLKIFFFIFLSFCNLPIFLLFNQGCLLKTLPLLPAKKGLNPPLSGQSRKSSQLPIFDPGNKSIYFASYKYQRVDKTHTVTQCPPSFIFLSSFVLSFVFRSSPCGSALLWQGGKEGAGGKRSLMCIKRKMRAVRTRLLKVESVCCRGIASTYCHQDTPCTLLRLRDDVCGPTMLNAPIHSLYQTLPIK